MSNSILFIKEVRLEVCSKSLEVVPVTRTASRRRMGNIPTVFCGNVQFSDSILWENIILWE
jgi:hypothetical protein